MRPTALTVAGSDSGGGAGIQADLKTFHHFGVYGTSALTLVTAQNTRGLRCVELLTPSLVAAQIDAVAEDLRPRAVKTGALGSAAIVEIVAAALGRHGLGPLVVDPVMLAKGGAGLLDADGVDALRRRLLPAAALVTPNLPEAAALLGGAALQSESDLVEAARALVALGARAALVKGGHASGAEVVDVLADRTALVRLRALRVDTPHTHGTGCTYAAAIAARLAQGDELIAAVRTAHAYVQRAIASAPGLGAGRGPLNHWA